MPKLWRILLPWLNRYLAFFQIQHCILVKSQIPKIPLSDPAMGDNYDAPEKLKISKVYAEDYIFQDISEILVKNNERFKALVWMCQLKSQLTCTMYQAKSWVNCPG